MSAHSSVHRGNSWKKGIGIKETGGWASMVLMGLRCGADMFIKGHQQGDPDHIWLLLSCGMLAGKIVKC